MGHRFWLTNRRDEYHPRAASDTTPAGKDRRFTARLAGGSHTGRVYGTSAGLRRPAVTVLLGPAAPEKAAAGPPPLFSSRWSPKLSGGPPCTPDRPSSTEMPVDEALYMLGRQRMMSRLSPSAVRFAAYSLVLGSARRRVRATWWMAALACRSPPRLSRCRWVLPNEAGIGETPHRAAKLDSVRIRSGLPPAVMSRAAATSGSTPKRCSSWGAASVVMGGDRGVEFGELAGEVRGGKIRDQGVRSPWLIACQTFGLRSTFGCFG